MFVSQKHMEYLLENEGPVGLVDYVRYGLENKHIRPNDIHVCDLVKALRLDKGDSMDGLSNVQRNFAECLNRKPVRNPERVLQETWKLESVDGRDRVLSEAAATGIGTGVFGTLIKSLLSAIQIEAYQSGGYIGDRLCTTQNVERTNIKIPGVTRSGGVLQVRENELYSETGFTDKWVMSAEQKAGRIMPFTEEVLWSDRTGLIQREISAFYSHLMDEKERLIIAGVQDGLSSADLGGYVYRPQGTGTALYPVAGTNQNYIGVSNTVQGAPFASANALTNWQSIDLVRRYRALHVKDDRVDGTPEVIQGINQGCTLLVPDSLEGTALSIVGAVNTGTSGATSAAHIKFDYANPVSRFITVGDVISSHRLDATSTADYYIGQFKRQFMWTEVWPMQTFTQGADSDAEFRRDVIYQVKIRMYGGISALDTKYVTKVDGA